MSRPNRPSIQLADLIGSQMNELLANWRRAARKLPVARDLSVPVLNNHMAQFLLALSAELKRQSSETLIKENGVFASSQHSVTHGLERLSLGFDLEEVVSEYNALRNCIFELAISHAIGLTAQTVHCINRVIDGAIGIAVKAFAAQQAREIRARRDEYLAFAVHDLRSPLATLSLATTLMERKHGQEEIELISIMRNAVVKLERLIERVLREDAAIRAEGRHQLDASWVDLTQLLNNLLEELKPLADSSGVELRLQAPSELSAFVDGPRLELIFQNLVSNAIRYTPGGRVVVQAQRSASGIDCAVRDNGCGIDQNRLAKIFEAGESDRPAGFGLGLSIVKRLVQAHGGALKVESALSQGTSFLFNLPASPCMAVAGQAYCSGVTLRPSIPGRQGLH